jgi:hypothetical protein
MGDFLDVPKITVRNIKYLGGHPDLPDARTVSLGKEDDALVLYSGFALTKLLSIPMSDVVNCTLERASKRSAGKAVAGAIVGGFLTGGIGALAGAAIGGRRRDDSVIVLTVRYGPATVDVLFGGDDATKKYAQFMKLLS